MKKRVGLLFLAMAFCLLLPSSWSAGEGRAQPLESVQQGTCHAVCNEQHGLVKGWTGPDRSSMAEAQKDADAHNHRYHKDKGDVTVICE